MAYVDGFVLPLPKKNIEAYREIADPAKMPFDGKRMIYVGFETLVQL